MNSKKSVIVYYSVSGQTDKVAHVLADYFHEDNCELIRLQTKEEIKPDVLSRYTKGVKAMMAKDLPGLKPYRFDADRYDRIILGFPNWASNCPPAMKEFIQENDLKGKEVWLYTTYVARGGNSCLKNVSDAVIQAQQIKPQVTKCIKLSLPSKKSDDEILERFSLN